MRSTLARHWIRHVRFVSTNDYFAVFRLSPSFRVDTTALKSEYRRLMQELHPDKHSQSPDLLESMEQQASLVTRAYDTLQRPHSRAFYLLEQLGHPLQEGESQEIVGAGFLLEILELRETLDALSDETELKREQDVNDERVEQVSDALQRALDEQDLVQAKTLAAKLQYLHRIEEAIREKL